MTNETTQIEAAIEAIYTIKRECAPSEVANIIGELNTIELALKSAPPCKEPADVDELWQPAETETPEGLHSNPDASAWAAYFVEVFPSHKHMEDTMLCWFANAMMAMHDSLSPAPRNEHIEGLEEAIQGLSGGKQDIDVITVDCQDLTLVASAAQAYASNMEKLHD